MTLKLNYIIDVMRDEEVGIKKIVLCDASRYAKNATGTMTYAGTLFTRKHITTQAGDEVIKTDYNFETDRLTHETNLSEVKRTLSALIDKGNVEVHFMDGSTLVGEIEVGHTYDILFQSDTDSMCKGFKESVEYCKDYIHMYNGTNHSYFEDFKGGTVSIRCNETEEVVYEKEIK